MHAHQVLIPIFMFIGLASVIYFYLKHLTDVKQEQQKTLQKLIDSGQPLSPELITSIAKPKSSSGVNKDLSRGLIAISLAVAVFIYGFYGLGKDLEFLWLGIFPFALGIAFLIIHKFKPQQ